MVLAATVAGVIAFVGWLPLAEFAFERELPDAAHKVMNWIFGLVDIQTQGAIGFAATGVATAATVVLLPAVLRWRGRAAWAAVSVIAAAVLAEGLLLALVTFTFSASITVLERLVFGQALAGLASALLWGRVHLQITGGRRRWPMAIQAAAAVSLVAFGLCTNDLRGVVGSIHKSDTILRVFVACTMGAFAAEVAMGIACLRSGSLSLEHHREPLAHADAE